MYTSHAYVGLTNYRYFKGNHWKDAMVKEACLTPPKMQAKSINSEPIAKICHIVPHYNWGESSP